MQYIPIYQTDELYREIVETFGKLLGRQRVSGAHSVAPVGDSLKDILLPQFAINIARDEL